MYHDFNLFSEEDKRRYRDKNFATDLQNVRDLGRRLVEMAAWTIMSYLLCNDASREPGLFLQSANATCAMPRHASRPM